MGNDANYSMSDLVRLSRLSRKTVRHYKKLGILADGNEDGGNERYSTLDLWNLGCAAALGNMGFQAREIAQLIDDDPFSAQHIGAYRDMLAGQVELAQAQSVGLSRYEELLTREGEVWAEEVEPFFIKRWPDGLRISPGFDKEAAPMCLPISGFGCLFTGGEWGHPDGVLLGRSVPKRHAHLIEGFSDDFDEVGGCFCVRAVHKGDGQTLLDPSNREETFSALRCYMELNRLKPVGCAFSTCEVISGGTVYIDVNLPVERAGLRMGRRVTGRGRSLRQS